MYYILYDIILLEPSMSFYASCDLWLSLTLTLSSKNRKIENKIKNEKENKEKLSLPFLNLTRMLYSIFNTCWPDGKHMAV